MRTRRFLRVHIPYGPSKSFIESFTKAGAKQLEPFGVRMNALMPGGSANRPGESDPDSNPYDVMVPAALFLASDAARDVTGQTFLGDTYNREHGFYWWGVRRLLPPARDVVAVVLAGRP